MQDAERFAERRATEYRILERVTDANGERVHLARLDESHSVCGHVTFDGSPFDAWQALDTDDGPEGDVNGERCLSCWATWEAEKRADRERRGQWNPPERTHKRAARRHVSPQVATQRIAAEAAERALVIPPSQQVFRMSGAELRELDTADARAEMARRKVKRAAKRAGVAQAA